MPRVAIPNGPVVEYPDSWTPEQIKGHLDEIGKAMGYAQQIAKNANTPPQNELDYSKDASFGVRAGESIKVTPEGKRNFLESQYGKENLGRDKNGNVMFRDTQTGVWHPVDSPNRITMGDVADMAGPGIDMAGPLLAGGTVNPFAIGAAAAASRGVRQGISAMLPGSDQMTPGQRAGDLATSGLLATTTQGAANLIAKSLKAPHNAVAWSVNRAEQKNAPAMLEAKRLSAKTGVQFTPGQETQSRGMLMAEGVARQHFASADKVAAFDDVALQKTMDYADNILSKWGPSSPSTSGASVKMAVKSAADKLAKIRTANGDKLFGVVDQMSGNSKIVNPDITRSTISSLVQKFSTVGAGDASAKLAQNLAKVSDDISQGLSARDTQRLLEIWGSAAKGKALPFEGMEKAQGRMIAGQVYRALQADLDSAAANGNDAVVNALRTARDTWRKDSQALSDLGNKVVTRALGKGAERMDDRVAQRIVNMSPDELGQTMGVLNEHAPHVTDSVKSILFQHILKSAEATGTKTMQSQEQMPAQAIAAAISPKKLASEIVKNRDKLTAVYGGREMLDIVDLAKTAARIADRSGMEGSQTTPLAIAWDAAKSVFTFNWVSAGRVAAGVIAPNKIANAMIDPVARARMSTMLRPSAPLQTRLNAAAYLSANGFIDPAPKTTGLQQVGDGEE